MADLRLESQSKGDSFLFGSYSFEAMSSPEPKRPRQAAAHSVKETRLPASTASQSQKQRQQATKNSKVAGVRGQAAVSVAVPGDVRMTSRGRQQKKQQMESQMTELPSDDDHSQGNTTSGGLTFNEDDEDEDDDYMTEPLFYA